MKTTFNFLEVEDCPCYVKFTIGESSTTFDRFTIEKLHDHLSNFLINQPNLLAYNGEIMERIPGRRDKINSILG